MTESARHDRPSGQTRLRRVCVRTGARLHFGLLDTVAPFGGIGVMIDRPTTEIVVEPADSFECNSPHWSRIRDVVNRTFEAAGFETPPSCQISIHQEAPSHCGLGSGTQLALATAEAISRAVANPFESTRLVTELAERGKRSAIGAHGYLQGGLIQESPHPAAPLNTVGARVHVNEDWAVAVFRPRQATEMISGERESKHFEFLPPATAEMREGLASLADRIIASADHADFDQFSTAVQAYNWASGNLFRSSQGGPYHGPAVTELVAELQRLGARGIGQSSWGPGVFAWFETAETASEFNESLSPEIETICIARPQNSGRQIQYSD